MKVLLLIPTYNESASLSSLLQQLSALPANIDYLFIDDCSPDGTASLLRSAQSTNSRLHLLARPAKFGLASAYLEGFAWGLEHHYDYLCQLDADLSHPLQLLPDWLAAIANYDLIIGSRYIVGGSVTNWSWYRRCLSSLGCLYARLVLALPIRDLTSGYTLWRSDFLRQLDLQTISSDGYCFQIEIKQQAVERGGRYLELPITFTERRFGQSKINYPIILEAFWRVWLLRFRSLALTPYKKFIKYILVGLMALTIDLSVMIGLVELFAWPAQLASSLAFIFSSLGGFFCHKFWTFRDYSRNYLLQYGQFALTALVGLAINYLLMGYLLSLGLHYVLARLIAIVIIFFWNFFINSVWAFKPIKTDLSTADLSTPIKTRS